MTESPEGATGASDGGTPPRRRRRVVRPGTETSGGGGSTSDDVPEPSERPDDANDARLRRDVPPHWG
ncbi:hypothetical protein [Paraoerskovia marina]|uniref:hypothetical protein n=1 Tax=Paraoerskovia marina TaxID=545619 RepID=UPI0012F7BEB1|nr:hypothetical protein [Paraoerskovia marina]